MQPVSARINNPLAQMLSICTVSRAGQDQLDFAAHQECSDKAGRGNVVAGQGANTPSPSSNAAQV